MFVLDIVTIGPLGEYPTLIPLPTRKAAVEYYNTLVGWLLDLGDRLITSENFPDRFTDTYGQDGDSGPVRTTITLRKG